MTSRIVPIKKDKGKPLGILQVLAICCAMFLSGCGSKITNVDSPGNNIICFGDSITYGTGAPEGESYPAYLSGLLGKDVINSGGAGDTTYDALKRLDEDILKNDPRIVIVELGGNDFLQKIPREETMENLKEIISKIQAARAMVALCDMSGGIFLSGYRQDYRRLAAKTGSIFIPRVLEDILTNSALKSDEIHPNSAGYKMIAEKVYKAVNKFVK